MSESVPPPVDSDGEPRLTDPGDEPPPSLRGEHGQLSEHERRQREAKGPLAWMAQNSVAANLLMALLLIGGVLMVFRVKQEVFPEFDLDVITIQVPYPGASPAEVEQAVILAVEESVRGIDGVKEVRSSADEGVASVSVELLLGTDSNKALSDIKAAVDRITSFPVDVERPIISLASFRSQVLALVVYGDIDEASLRTLGDQARDELIQDDRITYAELTSVRPLEVSIEVSQDKLREYGLTIQQVSQAVRAASVELPGGSIKTTQGEILLRTTERRDTGREFGEIVVFSRPDGTLVRVRDVATIDDGFRDTDQEASFNGKPAAVVNVFRVGDQTPLEVSAAVKEYIEEAEPRLPPGVKLAYWGDRSEMFHDRVDLLRRNAIIGLILVMFVLGLFLEIRLAFWVTLGIPISFIGTVLFMPLQDVSINMISLFAFIVTLGIVVDDAIVVGEAVYQRRRDGMPFVKASIAGLRDVATPVVFSVLTTVIAFSPLLFVPGVMGKFFRNIPLVVITVLLLSLVESLLILPAHLAHGKRTGKKGILAAIDRQQRKVSRGLERHIEFFYKPVLRMALRFKFLTVAACLALFSLSIGYVAGGHIDFTFLPKIEGDVLFAQVRMPYGTPANTTSAAKERMRVAAEEVLEEFGGADEVGRGMFAQLGAHSASGGPRAGRPTGTGGHLGEVVVILVPADQRDFTAADFAKRWREKIGAIAGAETLQFTFATGASGGAPIDVELSHRELAVLETAATKLAGELSQFSGVKDIENGFSPGKMQLDFTLKPEARALGITEVELARQLRNGYFGAEAVRQQRGREELRVYVRYPESERKSMHNLENLLLQTPGGGEIPLGAAAEIRAGRSFTSISRTNGRRVVNVTADIEKGKANATRVVGELQKEALPRLLEETPGLTYSLSGQQKRQAETLGALRLGFLYALIAMFALMAIPFKSYVQPLIIIAAIPFGFTGAIMGHVVMGYDLSIMSGMGIVALSGVVVNDSLVMIATTNENRKRGMSAYNAVLAAATRRFRPIMLTSLTTFFGLAPMILETSVQARFLIPMAISLGFGVLFTTFIILLLVPCLYVLVEQLRGRGDVLPGAGDAPLSAPAGAGAMASADAEE